MKGVTDIANTNLDVMVSVNIAPVDPYKALKIVNHQLSQGYGDGYCFKRNKAAF